MKRIQLSVMCVLAVAAPVRSYADEPAAAPTPPQVTPCADGPADMGCVLGGWFLRGSDKGPPHARPQAKVWVQTFYMDKNEVTVQRYKACVKVGKCKRARTYYNDYSRPLQPKVGVSWYHAVAYCKAMGKRLPTEAQWEKAARGTDGRTYPWGEEPATCKRAIIMDRRGRRSCGVKKQGKKPEKGRTWEVGKRPATQYGLFDMAGNSWEWVVDWYAPSYGKCGAPCQGIEPKGPCDGAEPCKRRRRRVVRGGSWYWPASYATTYYRRSHVPGNRPYHHFGFRCAASTEEAKVLGEAASAR